MPKATDGIQVNATNRSISMGRAKVTKKFDLKDQSLAKDSEGKAKKRGLSALSESTSSTSSTLPQEEAKRRRTSDVAPKESTAQPTAWKEFCKAGVVLFKGVAQYDVLQRKDSDLADTCKTDHQRLSSRIETLEESVRRHHQFVEQRLKEQAKSEISTVELIRSSLAAEYEKINTNMHETVEAAKTALVIRADDIEHEISNIRTTALELHALDLKITEVRNNLCLRLEHIERNQKQLPEILKLLKDIKTQLSKSSSDSSSTTSEEQCVVDDTVVDEEAAADHQKTHAEGREDSKSTADEAARNENEGHNLETSKQPQEAGSTETREKESEDLRIRKKIAETSKSLTKLRHEIFSLSHRVEEERRRVARQPEMDSKLRRLKMDKYGLLEREEYLKRKERDLKLKLYEWTKRPTYRPKNSPSHQHSSRHSSEKRQQKHSPPRRDPSRHSSERRPAPEKRSSSHKDNK